ncbi:MAG: M20/M25/M40 family metallo-hydrolase [Actinomycetota bacterium]
MEHRRSGVISALTLTLALGVLAGPVDAGPPKEVAATTGFRKAVTLEGVREHQKAFQSFADEHDDTRVSGTKGHEASARYVRDRMKEAGYKVRLQKLTFPFAADRSPPVLEQVKPKAKKYAAEVDFATFSHSGSGDVKAEVQAVDLTVPSPSPNSSTSGCEPADFEGFAPGNIALIQRGTCTFRIKADNAVTAGATGVIVFNEGNPGRTDVIMGSLGPPALTIPAIAASFAVGDELRNGKLTGPTGVQVHLLTDTIAENRSTTNVIADSREGDSDHVVVVGAHLDSVSQGPGINDNSSGSAGILEVAEAFASREGKPRNRLRFIWFGAEEFGLLGSEHYVERLAPDELKRIEVMLNFDMIGSPNPVRFVYDGDNSSFPPEGAIEAAPPGSGTVEKLFQDYFAAVDLASEPTAFDGRSDYEPFIAAGIPAGGLFTGAEGLKTAKEAKKYGGKAGEAYDRCYHRACDTFATTRGRLALKVLDQMSDAAAHAVLTLSEQDFEKDPLA